MYVLIIADNCLNFFEHIKKWSHFHPVRGLTEYLLCRSMLATLRCSHREFRRLICSLTSESSSSLRFPSDSKAAPARRTRPTLPWWVVSSTMYPCREKERESKHSTHLGGATHTTEPSLHFNLLSKYIFITDFLFLRTQLCYSLSWVSRSKMVGVNFIRRAWKSTRAVNPHS